MGRIESISLSKAANTCHVHRPRLREGAPTKDYSGEAEGHHYAILGNSAEKCGLGGQLQPDFEQNRPEKRCVIALPVIIAEYVTKAHF